MEKIKLFYFGMGIDGFGGYTYKEDAESVADHHSKEINRWLNSKKGIRITHRDTKIQLYSKHPNEFSVGIVITIYYVEE